MDIFIGLNEKEKYINPLIDNLPYSMRERVFEKVFEVAEIAEIENIRNEIKE